MILLFFINMSNYISNENQRLLWKSAHQIPTFANLDPPKKEFEFKKVVEYFYRKYTNANRPVLSIAELQQVNRETLSVFLPKSSVVPSSVPFEMVESRQDKSMRAFQERQNVYENMNKKPELPSPDEIFREKIEEEEKIQNMDELISNYQKQREMDYNVIAPPVFLPQQKNMPKKLKLLDETILTENDVDDLENSQIQQQKKSVSWKPDLLEPSKIDSLEMKMKELEKKNEDLENRIKEMEIRKNILENRMEEMESRWREKKKSSKHASPQKEKEVAIIVDATLKDIVHKIEKMDSIKNKMKMFSSVI